MHLKLPEMNGKITLSVLVYGNIPLRIWEAVYGKKPPSSE
jgi:hypothetical protein